MTINPRYDRYDELRSNIQKTETCIELTPDESRRLGYSFFLDGKVWEIKTELSVKGTVQDVSLYLNLPLGFPYELPKIFLESKLYDSIKYIPHINHEKIVCVYDEGMNPKIEVEQADEVLEYFIYKAKEIIQNGVNHPEEAEQEFDREFKAYWEGTYSNKDLHLPIGLHSISGTIEAPAILKGLKFDQKFQTYHFFLSNEEESIQSIKSYADRYKVVYEEIDVFYINNPFKSPPYGLSYKAALEILKSESGIYSTFKKYVNTSDWNNILVVFSSTFNSTRSYFGWTYRDIQISKQGFRKSKSKIEWMDSALIGRKNNVARISFDNITLDRLQKRTTGYVETQKSVVITGLGSVGSNLVFFLKNLPINKFHLIDKEDLSVDNIKRHLLGFVDSNYLKTTGVEKHILDFSPLTKTAIRSKSITEVIVTETAFINECDFHIVALGNSSLEEFILKNLSNRNLTKPTIFFWIEPFLASGQMIYVKPEDASKVIPLINNYPYHVIESVKEQQDITYLIEGGCQSGYFPYSSTYLIQFLSTIFPELKNLILTESQNSKIFSWIGDKTLIQDKGITISRFGNQHNTYQLIEHSLPS